MESYVYKCNGNQISFTLDLIKREKLNTYEKFKSYFKDKINPDDIKKAWDKIGKIFPTKVEDKGGDK